VPGFPLPLRNALAELVIAGLVDDDAAAALAWLAAPIGTPAPAAAARLAAVHLVDAGGDALLAVHAPHAAAVAEHAFRGRHAVEAFARHPIADGADAVARACAHAAALWNASLFFEVHEVLEAVWKTASGARRQALQGVIQIAVAFHHLAHGNLRGARSLMAEGRARLAAVPAGTLAEIDAAALLESTAPWESALAAGASPAEPPPPLIRFSRSA
jgi:hypothetical protein